MNSKWNLTELEGVELDDDFVRAHLSSSAPSSRRRHSSSIVSHRKLFAICDEFVHCFLVERWNELALLDNSVTKCMEVLRSVEEVLQDVMAQINSIQEEMGDVRQRMTQTSLGLNNSRVSELVLWGVISQLLIPPEVVSLLTRTSEERLGQQYKIGLQLLLRYLQYRRSTWKMIAEEKEHEGEAAEGSARSVSSSELNHREQCTAEQEQALRKVRVSFKHCRPYTELVRVLDSVSVLSCVKIKHFLSKEIQALMIPNTNIVIQQQYLLKEYALHVYFLKYAPGLLRHAHSSGVEGERQATLIPYRIARALYKEFCLEYCTHMSSLYLKKFKRYLLDCSSLEYNISKANELFLVPHGTAKAKGVRAEIIYVLPSLSDMVTAISGVEPWSLGSRGDILAHVLAPPLIPAIEKIQTSKHSYEETIRSIFLLLCDVVTHEFLFTFQLFCGETSVFFSIFNPIFHFLIGYVSAVVLTKQHDRSNWILSSDAAQRHGAGDDCYGILMLIRLCHAFIHQMNQARHLSCLNGFFDRILQVLWPAFFKTYDSQRIALRCVAISALAACSGGSSLSIEKKVSMVHPLVKALAEFSGTILSIALGMKDVKSALGSYSAQAKEGIASGPPGPSPSTADPPIPTPADPSVSEAAPRESVGIVEKACALLDQTRNESQSYSCTQFQQLLSTMCTFRKEVFNRMEELFTYYMSSEKPEAHSRAHLLRDAFLLNNSYYLYAHLHRVTVIMSRDESHEGAREEEESTPTVGRECELEDLVALYHSSRQSFMQNVIQLHFPEVHRLTSENNVDPEHPEDSSVDLSKPTLPAEVSKAAEGMHRAWMEKLNSMHSTIRSLLSDPFHEKEVMAQVCMEAVTLNAKFHALVNKIAERSPAGFTASSFLVSNSKLLVHMRSFTAEAR